MELFTQMVVTGIVNGAPLAVLGLGMWLILNVTQRFHFAFSLTYALGGFVAAVLATRLGLPAAVAVVAGLLAAAALGGLIELIVYRPLARRSGAAALLPIFVSGLGLAIGGQSLLQLVWARESSSVPFDLVALSSLPLPLGLRVSTLDGLSFVVFGLLAVASVAFLRYTRIGRVVRGVRSNPLMAEVVGIRAESVYIGIFVLASAAAGLAGAFSAAKYSAVPAMGYDPMFSSFVVAFLAGASAPALRVVIVGFGLGVVQAVSTLWVPTNLTSLVIFGILFVYLILKGAGMHDVFARLIRR